MTKERELTRAVSKILKNRPDCWFFKVAGGPYQRPGLPDFVACIRGRFIAIELKGPGGRVSECQAGCLDEIRRAGGQAEVCRTVQEVEAILTRAGSAGQLDFSFDLQELTESET